MEELSQIVEHGLAQATEWDRVDLDHALAMTRTFERIVIRAELDPEQLYGLMAQREAAGLVHLLVAYGAASLGDLIAHSMEAEDRADQGRRAAVDELGSRLQAATAALARLGEMQ